jgi:hypothetical protein
MSSNIRALIFSYSDSLYYFAGTTEEPQGQSHCVNFFKDEHGKLKKFPSLYRAKQALIHAGFKYGWLVMHSAYDEMIGNEPARNAELFMPFTNDSLS